MNCFSATRNNESLLRVYTLKHCYEECRNIDKQKIESYVTNCIIIRKEPIKNITDFGYKEQFKTNLLKRINFVYLPTLSDVICFIWAHIQLQQPIIPMILIENIETYIGHSLQYRQCGTQFTILLNLLQLLSNKLNKGRQQLFDDKAYNNLMKMYGITAWEIRNSEILKNSQPFKNNYTQNFIKTYSNIPIKHSNQ